MRKKVLIWCGIIAVFVSLGGYRAYRSINKKIAEVRTAAVTRGDIKYYLSTTGIVKSRNSKEYYGVQSRIKTVNVKVGDRVNKNDVLVVYDMPDLTTMVRTAELQLNNALLAFKELQKQSETINTRVRKIDEQIQSIEVNGDFSSALIIPELISAKETLSPISEEKLRQAQNAVSLAKLNVDIAKKKLNETSDRIRADFDGVVTTLNAVQGGISNGIQPAVIISDIENLKLMLSVGKHDANNIKEGKHAVVKSGGKQYNGRVSSVDPAARKVVSMSGESTSLGVQVDILERVPELMVDFDCDVDILIQEASDVVKAPIESIKTDKNGKNTVFVVKGSRAMERVVEVGLQSDTESEIISGLKEGEKVILNPGNIIKEGKRIKEIRR